MRNFKEAPEVINLSAEEMAILADDIQSEFNNIEADAGDVSRAFGTQEILEETKGIVADVPEMTPVENGLVSSIADMAVAGTDASAAEIIQPVLPGGVATEGIWDEVKKKAEEIWKKVKEFIAKIWAAITKFFSHIRDFFTSTEKRAEKAKEANDKMELKDPEPKAQATTVAEEPAAKAAPAEPVKPVQKEGPFTIGTQIVGDISVDGKVVPAANLARIVHGTGEHIFMQIQKVDTAIPEMFSTLAQEATEVTKVIKGGVTQEYDDNWSNQLREKFYPILEKLINDAKLVKNGEHQKVPTLADMGWVYAPLGKGDKPTTMIQFNYNRTIATTPVKVDVLTKDQTSDVISAVQEWLKVFNKFDTAYMGKQASAKSFAEKAIEAMVAVRPGVSDVLKAKNGSESVNYAAFGNLASAVVNEMYRVNRALSNIANCITVCNNVMNSALSYAEQSIEWRKHHPA